MTVPSISRLVTCSTTLANLSQQWTRTYESSSAGWTSLLRTRSQWTWTSSSHTFPLTLPATSCSPDPLVSSRASYSDALNKLKETKQADKGSNKQGFIDRGKDLKNSIAMNTGLEMYTAFVGYLQWLHVIFANPLATWLGVLPMGHLFDTTMTALQERQKNPDARPDLVSHSSWFRGLEKAKKDGSRLFNRKHNFFHLSHQSSLQAVQHIDEILYKIRALPRVLRHGQRRRRPRHRLRRPAELRLSPSAPPRRMEARSGRDTRGCRICRLASRKACGFTHPYQVCQVIQWPNSQLWLLVADGLS